jgi:glycosyltransferase involved in cell wall biosynthesis
MRLSVCLPTYNPGPFLEPALRSILDQRGVEIELLLSDDASDPQIQMSLPELEPNILRLHRNARRLGLVGNWNRCLELANGDPILIFHQDDRMRPNFLVRAQEALLRHPSAGFVFCNITTIDASGRETGGHWNPGALPASDTLLSGQDLIRSLLSQGNFIPCPTVVVRATAYREQGGFDSRLGYTPDLEMWLRIARRWDAVYLAEPLVESRRHVGQESSRFVATCRELREVRRAFQIYFERQDGDAIVTSRGDLPLPLDPDERASQMALARRHLRDWSRSMLRQALRGGRGRTAISLVGCRSRMLWEQRRGAPC